MENMSIESSSSFSLPKDLLIEILLCLPVKTLLRFKSVCKSWFILIDSSKFIYRHTAIATLPTPDKLGTFIFQSKRLEEDSSKIFSISGEDHEFEVAEHLDLLQCYREQMKSLLMVGSCNGIICLYNIKLRDVSLWNPSINQFRLLPRSSLTYARIEEVSCRDDFIAFGFDVETKDYKVVLVIFQPIYRVQVYSLSTDSWRILEDVVLSALPKDRNNGGYLNGSYYCSATRFIDKSTDGNYDSEVVTEVLSFDFTKEIFKTMQFPDEIIDINKIRLRLIDIRHTSVIILGEKIAILVHHMPLNFYELWVLNEVGVKESWTKLYKIEMECYGRLPRPRPIGISNNGEFMFMVTKKLWLLNPSTQVMKELQWDNNQIMKASQYHIWRAYVYRRSLVPVCCTRNGSTSELSLKLDTSSDNAVCGRHEQS